MPAAATLLSVGRVQLCCLDSPRQHAQTHPHPRMLPRCSDTADADTDAGTDTTGAPAVSTTKQQQQQQLMKPARVRKQGAHKRPGPKPGKRRKREEVAMGDGRDYIASFDNRSKSSSLKGQHSSGSDSPSSSKQVHRPCSSLQCLLFVEDACSGNSCRS